jgi:hypothetical protein
MTIADVDRRAPTQKPAAHGCGRALGETIHFEQNTMVDRTSQGGVRIFYPQGVASRSPDKRSDIRVSIVPHVAGLMRATIYSAPLTQKPAAHCCGRTLGETIHFEPNTMVDRTSQAEFEFFIHRAASRSPDGRSDIRGSIVAHIAGLMRATIYSAPLTQKPAAHCRERAFERNNSL